MTDLDEFISQTIERSFSTPSQNFLSEEKLIYITN
jgi:hypothetical protein